MQSITPECPRILHQVELQGDLAVIGGGMSGLCCAITAARAGLNVVLMQDRPVLGGNASSEVRMWIVGATSHMGNNNRWAREGGVIDEILLENTFRNPEGNPLIFDSILLEKAAAETNLRVLLNTAVYEVEKKSPDVIQALVAYCSQNETRYRIEAPLFCDSSGDGVVGFLSGAAFRMGAESSAEFGEKLAPSREYGELLGHTIYFYSKDTGRPVHFTAPSFALKDITAIPRWHDFNASEYGNKLWWIEYGGRLDTIHDSEAIKLELWKIVYGVWDHIKNSGRFPEAENLTLEWVGTIPGKRESRRFEGDYMLTQQDVIEQRTFEDAVSFGGWALDLHPADGIYSEKPGCNQWHAKGVYQIPYRSLYSCNIRNLFLAGRIISVTHVAFGSTRVQATLAHTAQAVGMAAVLCRKNNLLPAELSRQPWTGRLQDALQRRSQYIPGRTLKDENDLARRAAIGATSTLHLEGLPPDGDWLPFDSAWAQMIPLPVGEVPRFTFWLQAGAATEMEVRLAASSRPGGFTPDQVLASKTIMLQADEQELTLDFAVRLDAPGYVFVMFGRNAAATVRTSLSRVTGLLSVANKTNPEVSNYGRQVPEGDFGVDEFEFWIPQRRPAGQNLAFRVSPALSPYSPGNVASGIDRPVLQPNAWCADPADPAPALILEWADLQTIACLDLAFDTDFDNPLECFLIRQPEMVMPFCVKTLEIKDDSGRVAASITENHLSLRRVIFNPPLTTRRLALEIKAVNGAAPAALFGVRCYATIPE